MSLGYVAWALIALGAYTLVPPLTRLAGEEIPSNVVAFVSNGILVAMALGVVLIYDEPVIENLTHPRAIYMYGAGICLGVGILAYYRSLALGPVSIVTPIFAMFLVTSSFIGILFLNEEFTLRKTAGIVLGIIAVYLTSGIKISDVLEMLPG